MSSKSITGIIIAVVVLGGIIVLTQMNGSGKNQEVSSAYESWETTSTNTKEETNMDTGEENTGTLQTTVIAEGEGAGAQKGDTVTVNYTGVLENGTAFDSNVDPKFMHVEPFSFTLGENRVIAGWEQGILGMKKGEKRHLVVPASLGYGAYGMPPVIPANATLIFDVEVVSIASAQ